MTCNLLLAAKSVWRHSCSYEHNWLDLIIYIFRNNIYKKRKKRKDTYLDLHPQIHPSQNSRNITLAHSWIYKMLEVSYLSGEVGKAIVSDSVLKTRPTLHVRYQTEIWLCIITLLKNSLKTSIKTVIPHCSLEFSLATTIRRDPRQK